MYWDYSGWKLKLLDSYLVFSVQYFCLAFVFGCEFMLGAHFFMSCLPPFLYQEVKEKTAIILKK